MPSYYSYPTYSVASAAYTGTAVVKGLVFHRGKAATNAGMYDMNQAYSGRYSGSNNQKSWSAPDAASAAKMTMRTNAFIYNASAPYTTSPSSLPDWAGAPIKSWWGVYLSDPQLGGSHPVMGASDPRRLYIPAFCPNSVKTTTRTWTVTNASTVAQAWTETEVGGVITSTVGGAIPSATTTSVVSPKVSVSACPAKQWKVGCGGVAQVYGAQSSHTTFLDCDFKYGIALQGGSICVMGRGSVLLKGTPVNNAQGLQVGAGDQQKGNGWDGLSYQQQGQDQLTGSLCNFERNQAHLAGGVIFAGYRPYVDGSSGTTSITISGCNFFRNIAFSQLTDFRVYQNGGVLATTGGPGYSFTIKDRSSFYENKALRGGVMHDLTTKFSRMNKNPALPGAMWVWGWDLTVENSYFIRNGWADYFALRGCLASNDAYGCNAANNEGFAAHFPNGGMAAIFETWSSISRNTTENLNDPTDYRWREGQSGSLQTPYTNEAQSPGSDRQTYYRGLGHPGAPTTPTYASVVHTINQVNGYSITPAGDPMWGYPCKGFDQAGYGPDMANLFGYTDAGNFGNYYSPYTYPRKFFENCGSAGVITKMNTGFQYGGSMYEGAAATHGGAFYMAGGHHTVNVKGSQFVGNTAYTTGGVFKMTDLRQMTTGKATFESCEFTRNAAGVGGAVQIYGRFIFPVAKAPFTTAPNPENYVDFFKCTFRANIAYGNGGAIEMRYGAAGAGHHAMSNSYPLTKMVRPPDCKENYKTAVDAKGVISGYTTDPADNTQPCPEVSMYAWGPDYHPRGTKQKLVIRGTVRSTAPTYDGASSADSRFEFNIAGRLGGVAHFGVHEPGSTFNMEGLPTVNSTNEFVATDTLFYNNGVRLFGDVWKYIPSIQAGHGGVLSITSDFRVRYMTCTPSEDWKSDGVVFPWKSAQPGCGVSGCPGCWNRTAANKALASKGAFPTSEGSDHKFLGYQPMNCPWGRTGMSGTYDACLYEHYVMDQKSCSTLPTSSSNFPPKGLCETAAGQASIPIDGWEKKPTYTFTRCNIEGNFAPGSGGVVMFTGWLRDWPHVIFDRSLVTKNVALSVGGVAASGGPDPDHGKTLGSTSYPNEMGIRRGVPNFPGRVEVVGSIFRGNGAGRFGGVFWVRDDTSGEIVIRDGSTIADSNAGTELQNDMIWFRDKLWTCTPPDGSTIDKIPGTVPNGHNSVMASSAACLETKTTPSTACTQIPMQMKLPLTLARKEGQSTLNPRSLFAGCAPPVPGDTVNGKYPGGSLPYTKATGTSDWPYTYSAGDFLGAPVQLDYAAQTNFFNPNNWYHPGAIRIREIVNGTMSERFIILPECTPKSCPSGQTGYSDPAFIRYILLFGTTLNTGNSHVRYGIVWDATTQKFTISAAVVTSPWISTLVVQWDMTMSRQHPPVDPANPEFTLRKALGFTNAIKTFVSSSTSACSLISEHAATTFAKPVIEGKYFVTPYSVFAGQTRSDGYTSTAEHSLVFYLDEVYQMAAWQVANNANKMFKAHAGYPFATNNDQSSGGLVGSYTSQRAGYVRYNITNSTIDKCASGRGAAFNTREGKIPASKTVGGKVVPVPVYEQVSTTCPAADSNTGKKVWSWHNVSVTPCTQMITIESSTIKRLRTYFDRAITADGGLLWAHGYAQLNTINSVFRDNRMVYLGLAVMNLEGIQWSDRSSFFINNTIGGACTSTWPQGAIAWFQSSNYAGFKDSTFQNNGNECPNPGALFRVWDSALLSLNNCSFQTNYGASSGVIGYLTDKANVEATNSTFTNNVMAGGGAFHLSGQSRGTITDSVFAGNKALGYGSVGGGAVYLDSHASIAVSATTFKNNYARVDGGVIHVKGKSGVTLNDCVFSGNTAIGNGGAVFIEGDFGLDWNWTTAALSPTHQSTTYLENLPMVPLPEVGLSKCTFTGNTAYEKGGAVAMMNGIMHVHHSTLVNNTARQSGGALALLHMNSTAYVYKSALTHNKASETGGAIYSVAQMTSEEKANLASGKRNCTSPRQISNTMVSAPGSPASACTGGTLLLADTSLQQNSAVLLGGALSFLRWPNQTSPVLDTATVTKTTNNGAGGGGVAGYVSRKMDLDKDAFMASLAAGSLARNNGSSAQTTLYGPRIAALGGRFTLVQQNTNFMYSAGQLENPDYPTPLTSAGVTTFAPDKLKLVNTLLDGFSQTVRTADEAKCDFSATLPGATNRFTLKPLSIAAGTTKVTLSQGQNLNANLRLEGYLKPLGKVNNAMTWEKRAAVVATDCNEDLRKYRTIPCVPGGACEATLSQSVVLNVSAGDCPEGYYPIFSQSVGKMSSCPGLTVATSDYCSVVQMCAPCNPGFFSSELNTQCVNCPNGATSAKGSFGIRQCACPAKKYIEFYKYSKNAMIPPVDRSKSKNMQCLDCPKGGECSVRVDKPGVGQVELSVYPYPQSGNWKPSQDMYKQDIVYKGIPMRVEVDLGPKPLYECPFDSCPGGFEGNCSSGYAGIVCGVCAAEYELTINGCLQCQGVENYIILLIFAVVFIPIVVVAIFVASVIGSAHSKLCLTKEISRVFKTIDFKKSGTIPGKQMQKMYNMMSGEELALADTPAAKPTTLGDFITLVLEGKSPLDITPEDATMAVEVVGFWDKAGRAFSDQRLQICMVRALSQYQNADLNQTLLEEYSAEAGHDEGEEEEEEEFRADDDLQAEDLDEEEDEEEEEEEEEDDEEYEAEDMEDGTAVEEGEDPLEDLSAQLKIVTSHFQVLGGSTGSMKIKMPSATKVLTNMGSLFMIDFFALLSIDCIQRVTFYDKLHFFIGIPAMALLLMMMGVQLVKHVFAEINLEDFKTFIFSKFMILMFLIYPMLCQTLLTTFKCREIEGKWWLTADLTKECYTSEWSCEMMIALIGIFAFPIGFPTAIYVVLSRNRHRLHNGPKLKTRFGFVFVRYEPQFWFWETTEMLRKFTLCGMMIFIQQGSMTQVAVSILCGAFFLCAHVKFQPFDDDLDDNLQSAALLATFLTLTVAIMIKTGEAGPATTGFILLVNLSVLAIAIYALIKDTIPTMVEQYTNMWDDAMKVADTLLEMQSEMEEFDQMAGLTAAAGAGGVGAALAATDTKKDGNEPIDDSTEKPNSELDNQIERLFRRYDLDLSGTINSWDELEQLVCNLGYRLELDLNPTQIDDIIAKVKSETDDIDWDLPQFSAWYKATFNVGD